MSMVPIVVSGERRLIRAAGRGVQDSDVRENEEARKAQIRKIRKYVDGSQFDEKNETFAQSCTPPLTVDELAEHQKLHPYSTQIAESVAFIAGQLSEGMRVVAKDKTVQQVLDAAFEATDLLATGSEVDELAVDELLMEAGQTGDVPVEVRWDPVEETPYLEFWPSEQVEFDVPSGQNVAKVIRRETVYADEGTDQERPVEERVEYEVVDNDYGQRECVRRVFHDEEEEVVEESWLGLPFIPWSVVRINRKGIRGFRGEPLVTQLAMRNADRYNAVEQVSFLIARYNSHGNLVVVGDQAMLDLQHDPRVAKDVADVLRFPGGTNAFALTLPTDPQMIEHQRAVTADAIYAAFGLVRVEPDTLQGLGGVSGYALEILNRKSEGTFRRIRRTFKRDWLRMLNMVLDVAAYRAGAVVPADVADELELDEYADDDLVVEVPFWDIDPAEVYPNRVVDVRLGSGYIVDDVQVRDDFTSKLISRREALRKRGYADPEIKKVESEISDEAQSGGGETGTEATGDVDASVAPLVEQFLGGAQAGRALGSTERQ